MPTRARIARTACAAALVLLAAGCSNRHPGSPALGLNGPPLRTTTTGSTGVSNQRAVPVTKWTTSLELGLGQAPGDLVGGPDGVYALVAESSHGLDAVARVDRLEISSMEVQTDSPPIPGAVGMAISDDALWVPITPAGALIQSGRLDERDPTTLALRQSFSFPTPARAGTTAAGVISAAPDGDLWIGVFDRLYRLSPTKGQVTGAYAEPGAVTGVSVSPDSQLVYVATASAGGSTHISERDTDSGALIATKDLREPLNGARVSASSTGVWASYSAGTLGATVELRSSDLAQVVPANGATPTIGTPFATSMGPLSTVSGGVLWLSSPQSLACANPVTGKSRADDEISDGSYAPVVAYHGAVYVPTTSGVDVVSPPSACGVTGKSPIPPGR